jgi:hypothetical protein
MGRVLRGEWCASPSREGAGEFGEDHQVGVECDAVQPANAKRQQRPPVLEPSELALDEGASPIREFR